MTNQNPKGVLTHRDIEILAALARCPLTVEQLLKLSQTFEHPFPSSRRVRRRFQVLCEAGKVNRFRYAVASKGSSPCYFRPTLKGYRLVFGKDSRPSARRLFSEVSVGHHHHSRSLADFIVHTFVSAGAQGLTVTDFCGENTVKLPLGNETLLPDCCFRLIDSAGKPFNFLVELDNSTETLRTKKNVDNWQRKIRLYERYQDVCQSRFRVLVLTTRSQERLDHILDVAFEEAGNTDRQVFYGAYLPNYLAHTDAVSQPCFLDHSRDPVALIPGPTSLASQNEPGVPITAEALAPMPEFG